MNEKRFDGISRLLASQSSRRVFFGGVGAFVATLLMRPVAGVHIAWEAYLQEGTCTDTGATRVRLGDPVYGVPVGVIGTPAGTPPVVFQQVGASSLVPVLTSTASVSSTIDDLLAAPNAIVVEQLDIESGERTVLACGNVGGVPTDGEVLFGLEAVVADTSGIAWLKENSDGTTTVTLFVTQGLAADETAQSQTPVGGATPIPTSEAETTGPPEVTVTSLDIYFDPSEFTIPADTDVVIRLPNKGVTMHNFSITDHNNPDVPNLGISIDLQPGAEESVTVNAPAGDYYYFCNVPGHEAAGMFGTMHVVNS